MTQNEMKQLVAKAALEHIGYDMTIGIGTGSTINYFIEELVTIKGKLNACVSSSDATTERLKSHGFNVIDLNSVDALDLYIDGADEVNHDRMMIKGGGGALTREKIVAAAAKQFLCLVDESKVVDVLGKFPLPIEVVPMARSYVAREMVKLGGLPTYRDDFVTDNGNIILDVQQLNMTNPIALEQQLNQITGIITNGLFAIRPADQVLVGSWDSVKLIED